MLRNEGQKVKVEGLELEVVLHLVCFNIGIDEETNWNRFDRVIELLEVGQVELSYCLVLGALDQAENECFIEPWRGRVFLDRKLVQKSEHMSRSYESH